MITHLCCWYVDGILYDWSALLFMYKYHVTQVTVQSCIYLDGIVNHFKISSNNVKCLNVDKNQYMQLTENTTGCTYSCFLVYRSWMAALYVLNCSYQISNPTFCSSIKMSHEVGVNLGILKTPIYFFACPTIWILTLIPHLYFDSQT